MFLVLILSLWLADSAAFTFGYITPHYTNVGPSLSTTRTSQLQMEIFSESEPAIAKKKKDRNESIQKDMDQKQVFQEGSAVRVIAKNLKAFSVPAKGCGMFDDDKKFVPCPEDTGVGARYLAIPVGLVGQVAKVIDTDQISANNPIQVKFDPEDNQPDGYKFPVGFLFHFSPEELERIE